MQASIGQPRTTGSRSLLAVLLGGQTMASLDGSIVNVALPSIARDLHASGAALQATVAGYLLAYAVLLVAGARLGDSRGHRELFIGGLAAFTGASVLCGVSTTIWMLIAARVVQGAAAAFMVPQVLSLIQRCFEGAERARALSWYSAILSLGVAAGQVIGGVLVSANLGGSTWRAVFAVNAPVGAALLVAARRSLPAGRVGARPFDVPGMLALAVTMLLLVVPLAMGREMGWPAWSVACLVLAAPALVAFGLVERAATALEPLVDLTLLRDGVVAAGLAAIVAVMAGYAAFIFMFALHLQSGLGYSPLRSSLTFLPYALGFGAASLNWRRLPARWHPWIAPAGFALLAAGEASVALSLSGPLQVPIVAPLMFLAGGGHAAAFAPLAVAVTARARREQASSLSGLLSTGTTLAAVLGVAVGGGAYLSAVHASGSTRAFQLVAGGLAAAMLLSGVAALWVGGRQTRTGPAREPL
ncbi:MAG TPA: MFS transporter [Candidatus Dormibacteraeota bacterium]